MGEGGDRRAPALGDVLELAVAVELVAEEVAERDDARAHAHDHLGQGELVHLEQAELGVVGREQGGGDARGEVGTGVVPGQPVRGAEDAGEHRARRRLPVRRRDDGDAGRQPGRECVDRTRIDLPEQLAGQRRAAAAPGRAREAPDEAGGARLESRGGLPCGSRVPGDRVADRLEPVTGPRSGPLAHSRRMLYSDCTWPGPVVATRLSPGSTRQLSRSFAPASDGATPTSRSSSELRASAGRLGRSPTMREFAADPEARVHPQTVIEHFGTWNAAKRAAGLTPRRFISREELLEQLRELGDGARPDADGRDLDANRRRMASKSLIWHTFGSLTAALKEAGFDVPVGEEKLERAVEQGAVLARALRRLPKMADWKDARRADPALMTEWQVYRLVDIDDGPVGGIPVPRARAPARGGRQGGARRLAVGDGRAHPTPKRPTAAGRARQTGAARLAPTRSAWRAWRGRKRLRAPPARRGAACRRGSCDRRESASRSTMRPRSRWSSRPSETSCLRRVSRRAPSTTSSAALRGGEEELAAAAPDPERPGDPAGEVERVRHPLVDPGRRHRAAKLLERP